MSRIGIKTLPNVLSDENAQCTDWDCVFEDTDTVVLVMVVEYVMTRTAFDNSCYRVSRAIAPM